MNLRKLLNVLLVISFLALIAFIFNSASLLAGVIASAYILPFFVVLLMVYGLLYVGNFNQHKIEAETVRHLSRKCPPKHRS